jgi:DNA integrity scanning protein DisA with diadenylate cyclase activity
MLDKLNSVALKLVLTLSYKFIDVVQSNDSKDIPEKIVALGVILLLLCERFGIRPARVLEIAGRCMSTASDAENNWMVQFDALRTYMAKEL